ncbi:MAG: hypothetical protein WCL32_13210 [Planctomycetota bacterium]
MGIQIQFVEKVREKRQLCKQKCLLREANGDWIAPEINVVPVKELKLIHSVEMRVAGRPDVVASRLQSAFGDPRRFKEPYPLSQSMAVSSGRVKSANPLPSMVNCELRVFVRYFDVDATGKPVGEAKEVTEAIVLYTGDQGGKVPMLKAQNVELQALVGTPTLQVIDVYNALDNVEPPTLKLVDPETLLAADDPDLARFRPLVPELQAKLTALLKAAPFVDESDPTIKGFRYPMQIDLSQAAKSNLADIENGVSIAIEATYANAKPIRWLLKLEAESQIFDGWVVIDFGTTNSTVTLYDSVGAIKSEGLPQEQEEHLSIAILDFLKKDVAEALGARYRALETDWNRLRKQTLHMVQLSNPEDLDGWLKGDNGARLNELIAHLEIHLQSSQQEIKRAVYAKLHEIYHTALHVPPLQRNQLFPMRIEPDLDQETISSELEIMSIQTKTKDKDDRWPQVQMGIRAQKNRLKAIGEAKQSIAQIESRFHPSPKRYFGSGKQLAPVVIDNKSVAITVDQLMRAGWEQLRTLAEEARGKSRLKLNPGKIRRAVITYPTIAPPSVRQNIQKLMRDLGIADVRTDYDEAIASAIFYIMREYNAASEMGLEDFKARAVKVGDGWVQNLLVFDIGGGTTDVALIRLTLHEESTGNQERGAGGRYYRLTPEVLSSTGHMELGGELMTLRIFRFLKALIADRLLTLVQDNKWSCEPVKNILDAEVPQEAKSQNKYKSGWLWETVRDEIPEPITGRLEAALKLAERLFPTNWENVVEQRSVRLQAFYTLWEKAELAKKELGSKRPNVDDSEALQHLAFKGDVFRELVGLCYDLDKYPFKNLKGELDLRLTALDIEKMIERVVDEAVNVAAGALERLPGSEKVDWLILSGQSCNLRMVDRKIREKFQKANKFVWNPERVTFLPQYAKLSTSIGACYAESVRRKRFSPSEAIADLQRGINYMYFDVRNLFSRLPCSFFREGREVLKAGTELFDVYGIDHEDKQRGIARSEWMGSAILVELKRVDFKNGKQPIWGISNVQLILDQHGWGDSKFIDEVWMQFEIDHRLNVDVLYYRRDPKTKFPHYRLADKEERTSLPQQLLQLEERLTQGQLDKAKKENPKTAAGLKIDPVKLPPLFDANRILQWTIHFGGPTAKGPVLFEAGQTLDAICHAGANVTVRMALSKNCASAFLDDGSLFVWAKHPAIKDDVKLAVVRRPGDRPVFPRRYRFTLDENGILRVHPGEPAYQESKDASCLASAPGCVLRRPLTASSRATDDDRNPFNGKH